MKPKVVVWDVDDVLTPTSETFYKAALRTHGSCPHPDHWSDYLWGRHVGLDEGEPTQQYLIDQRIIETSEPYPYTEQALSLTKKAGLKNVLLSARAWHPNPNMATSEWLARFALDPLVHDMYFVKVEESKRNALMMLLDIYDICAFVEDNPHHVKHCPLEIPNVYLVRRSWNTQCHDDPRFHCVSTSLEAATAIATSHSTKELV